MNASGLLLQRIGTMGDARWCMIDVRGEVVADGVVDPNAEWAENVAAHRTVAEDLIAAGRAAVLVSTIFLGLWLGGQPGRPEWCFESKVFGGGGAGDELDGRRYATLADARAGHAELVRHWSAKLGGGEA